MNFESCVQGLVRIEIKVCPAFGGYFGLGAWGSVTHVRQSLAPANRFEDKV